MFWRPVDWLTLESATIIERAPYGSNQTVANMPTGYAVADKTNPLPIPLPFDDDPTTVFVCVRESNDGVALSID